MLIYLLIFVAIALVALVLISAMWPKIATAVKAAKPPASPSLPMFIDGNGNQFDITPAKPCEVASHCRYEAPVVSITEPCALTKTEEAISTVTSNTKRIRKVYRDAKQALMDFIADEKETAA